MPQDQTAIEFSQSQPVLVTPLHGVVDGAPSRQLSLLACITFCFAWLFGLEPFLTGAADNPTTSGADRP
ncbi:type IV secretory pathway VirB2 component (pilin) [Burkholderia sp. OAS925]|uniref:hypothetical protein n=1 Tax=Paraburkholderia TaxID=1822464 RepID=UPI00178912D3|nr:hypothetical protein [Paraburkholderia graminis]MDR6478792.1 type IV secretory pathway VirB2 component (pilin) [Paraburkholderia graminis]